MILKKRKISNIISEIKSRSNIVEIARSLIPKLRKVGRVWVGTIRDEKTPALTIYEETQSWFHFAGDCTPRGKSGGDVIALIEYIKNCSTSEAIKFLAQRLNIPLKPLTEEEKQIIEKQKLIRTILFEAAHFYHQILLNDPGAEKLRNYLSNRGFSKEVIERNFIGLARDDDKLLPYLTKKGFTLEDVKATGLVTESNHDFYQFRIIFPLWKEGSVVYMTGRQTEDTPDEDWEQSKYKHLPSSQWIQNSYFYNEDVLQNVEEVTLCEGIPDCLTLQLWGFNAIAILGNKLKDELVPKLRKLKTVYVTVHTDGKSDPLEIANKLEGKSKIITLPSFNLKTGGKGKDINDFMLAGYTKEDFEALIKNAKTMFEYQLPESLREYKVDTSQIEAVYIQRDNYQYQISNITNEKQGIRAQIILIKDDRVLNKDRLLLVSGKSRMVFAKACSDFDEEIEIINRHLCDIESILQLLEKKEQEKREERKKLEKELSEEERLNAIERLKSPTLLYDIKCIFPKLKIAGEEENGLLIYLTFTSRLLDQPVSLIPKGESSAGKSYLVGQIMKLFPKEAYEDLTDATARSFYHAEKDAFKHKIIVMFEKHGTELADYSIRSLQSENKLRLQLTIKDPKTQQFRKEVKTVDGPTGFITTTTEAQIHVENETRNFSLYADESDKQTARIFEMIDSKYRGIFEMSQEELLESQNMQNVSVLKSYPVLIPFVERIRRVFPIKPLRVRRDYGRFLTLIEASAILHQYQREKVAQEGIEFIKASFTDYYIAKIIGERMLRQSIFELPPKSKELVEKAKELLEEKKEKAGILDKEFLFTIRELSLKINQDYDTVRKWFQLAYSKGYFEKKKEHKGSKAAEYTVIDKNLKEERILPVLEDLRNQYPNLKDDNTVYNPIAGKIF